MHVNIRGIFLKKWVHNQPLVWAVFIVSAFLFFGCETPVLDWSQPTDSQQTTGLNPGAGEDVEAGQSTWRRLNRVEYNNTVRDLLNTSLTPADDFPSDEHGYGFDNIAEVLSLSPLHLELFERAADLLVADALRIPLHEPAHLSLNGSFLEATCGESHQGIAWNLWSNGEATGTLDLPLDGTYFLGARVWARQAGDEDAQVRLLFDGDELGVFDITGTLDHPQELAVSKWTVEGEHTLTVEFLNEYYEPTLAENRQVLIGAIQATGPTDLLPYDEAPRFRVFTCDGAEVGNEKCARQILEEFGRKAWRRPLNQQELDGLMALVQLGWSDGLDYEEGLGLGLKALFLSPDFLFRVELLEDPFAPVSEPLTDFEIASRLSYFLWSSMPDDILFELAQQGQLRDPEIISAQVARMIEDPRSNALVDNFAGQWLYMRSTDDVSPDPWHYPDFDEALRHAMRTEMELFFETFLFEERSMLELLTGTDVFVNERLAQHYGIAGVTGEAFQRMDGSAYYRGGLLAQAGLLTILSKPTRTSVVKRGKWVLTQLLCSEPAAPPPGVEALIDSEDAIEGKTLKQVLEVHRSDPACAGCHAVIDPIGFGLEKFDGIGARRELDNEIPIDDTGVMENGSTFSGAREMAEILVEDERYASCIVEQLFVYGLGRGIQASDTPYLEEIEAAFVASDYRLSTLIQLIATSVPFRYRMGEVLEGGTP
jgi:hypothetical protein